MSTPSRSPKQQYLDWVEDRIEDYKSGLTREELLSLADHAVTELFGTEDGQYPLTEILLRDAVDGLIFQRLELPGYRRWLRTCQSDTDNRHLEGTHEGSASGGEGA
jgi:hypothetical protein